MPATCVVHKVQAGAERFQKAFPPFPRGPREQDWLCLRLLRLGEARPLPVIVSVQNGSPMLAPHPMGCSFSFPPPGDVLTLFSGICGAGLGHVKAPAGCCKAPSFLSLGGEPRAPPAEGTCESQCCLSGGEHPHNATSGRLQRQGHTGDFAPLGCDEPACRGGGTAPLLGVGEILSHSPRGRAS